MRVAKILGAAGALVLSALVGGTLIGSAFALDEETDTDGSTATGIAYCQTFRDALASELGVTTDELLTAGKAAANATIDAAVAAGDIDEERAATMRQRVDAFDGECDELGHGFGRAFSFGAADRMGLGRGPDRGMAGGGRLEAAADALGMDPVELRDALVESGSLEAVAGDAYADVKAAVLADVQARLDEAVANGLDQERADTMLERVTTWLDDGGQLEEMGRGGFGPGHGRGHGGMGPGFGAWSDSDDSEEEEPGA